jgi:ATP-dependent 26S proteasome regulatory subunit
VDFNENLTPRFIEMSTLTDCKPIFSKAIENSIRVNIHNPIKYSARCRKRGASLKKGVILGGPYGTGKTLEAFETANICLQNGWTFLYLQDVRDLDLAIGFAKLYQPCVLFAEDIDKATSGQRSSEMDRLLNTIDGVESKGKQELMIVLTTNHLEVVNRAFLRPGRIDCVINVMPPDKEACLRIMKMYIADGGCKVEGSDEEFMEAIKCLVGANAAFFRNTIEQAKLSAIEAMTDDDSDIVIRPADVQAVAEGMVAHARLINPEHGLKSLVDMEEESADPMQFAMDILTQKAAEAFVAKIANPKTLEKIMIKSMKPRRGGGFSSN